MSDNLYFANLPREEIAGALYERVTSFYEQIETDGRLALWRKSHQYYYALNSNGTHQSSGIRRGGEQGELHLLFANHYRNLLQHLHVLTTQQRAVYECRAVNMDTKSQIQTIFGRNILEYYLREKRLEILFRLGAELGLAYGEAYAELEWDPEAGDPVRPDADPETGDILPGRMVKTGDVCVRMHEPIRVPRPSKGAGVRLPWYIPWRYENKWDLASKHPEHREAILSYTGEDHERRAEYYDQGNYSGSDDEDLIPLYVFYHDRTPACPSGRRVEFIPGNVCLKYETLDEGRYADMPMYPMLPAPQHDTTYGYTVGFDLLGVQEGINSMYSTVLSNQRTFGVQNIWVKPGSNLSPNQLGGGLNVFESTEKPEAINLTNTPPEIFNFLKGLEQLGEVLSGVNSVARGQPEASLKSGAALALVASQAVQFSNGLQAAYVRLQEDVGTALLKILQTRAVLPRAAMIAGRANKSYMKEFTGDDIRSINRVIVDVGNPMSRTVAGRIQMAQDLLQAQVIKSPQEYIHVVETGNTEPMTRDAITEDLLIDSENEALRAGKSVMAIVTDAHKEHIESHKLVLGGADERMDPVLVQRVNDHIQEHIRILRTADPALLNFLGQAPIQVQPNGAPTPPQGANAPQPNAQPQQPQPGQPMPAPEGTPPAVADQMPSLPQVPPGTPTPAA